MRFSKTDTRYPHLSAVTVTVLENSGIVVGGHIPHTTHLIIDVLAESGSAGAILAPTEAEFAIGHKVLEKDEMTFGFTAPLN